MSSNSPVLLLAPTSVPTGPVLAPMLLTKMEARTRALIQTTKPAEVSPTKPTLALAEIPPSDSTDTKAPAEVVPATPAHATASSASTTADSPAFVFSPREPTAKIAHSAALSVSKVANAAPVVGVPPTGAMSPVSAVTAPVSQLTIQAPVTPTPMPTPLQMTSRSAASKRVASSIAAPPSPVSAPSSPGSTPSSPSGASSPKPTKSHTGRWTEAEHKLFLKGLEQFPYRAWKKIATLIKTRTVVQIRTHAQKYYQKLEKEEQRMREREAQLAAQQGAASAVSTPRAEPMSAPSTPAATSFHELSQPASSMSPAPSSVASSSMASMDLNGSNGAGAAGKRKAPLRKRKGSSDEQDDLFPPSSLPKRMMKEKKFIREKTMSPKQKTVVAGGRMLSFADHTGSSSDAKSSAGSIRGLSTHPLDFDDADDVGASTSMILDFAEEKPIVDYPFALDSALERGLAAIDQDELLQLSDDENMDWFSAAAGEQEGEQAGDDATSAASPVSSPLSLGCNPFSPLYSEDCLQFVDPAVGASECSTPSSILDSADDCSDFALSGDEHDEDDDFVLDPEKFLSSYFQPDASIQS